MSGVVNAQAQKCSPPPPCEFNLRDTAARRGKRGNVKGEMSLTVDALCAPCQPVFLSFRITAGAGKPNANKHKCCVVQ